MKYKKLLKVEGKHAIDSPGMPKSAEVIIMLSMKIIVMIILTKIK